MSLFYCQIIPNNKISMMCKDAKNLTEKYEYFLSNCIFPIGGLKIWTPMKY